MKRYVTRYIPRAACIFLIASSISGCWAVAAGAGAEAGYVGAQKDRTAGQTIDDQAIVTRIKSQYLADSEVSALDVHVESFKGQVTLKGVVRNQHEADKAVRIARDVSGVREVHSRLVVE